MILLFGTVLRSQVYYFKFSNPKVNSNSLTWTVSLHACSESFYFLSGNLRYNFNNKALSTNGAIDLKVTHPYLLKDAVGFLGTIPNKYANVSISTSLPENQGLLIDTKGITIGTITHPLTKLISPGATADIYVREFNVPGYSLPLPAPLYTNNTKIFTLASPITPVQACMPANGLINTKFHYALLEFSVGAIPDTKIKLDWTTSFGQSVDYFDIERSDDGVNWSNIGSVKASENSNSKLEYSYIDNKLPLNRSKNQIFYYRLRMTDLDGKFEYSDVRGVNFNRTSDWAVSIYPNPTADLINVDLTGLDLGAGDINLSVYDNVARQVISKKIIGNGIELIDVTQLPAGSYNVTVNQGNINHRQTIIKID